MTAEQDDSHAIWQDTSAPGRFAYPPEGNPRVFPTDTNARREEHAVSWDQPFDTGTDDTSQGSQQLYFQEENDMDEWVQPGAAPGSRASFTSLETLQRFGRQFSPVLVPLPFALLIFLFTIPVALKGNLYLPLVPLAIVLLALAVLQGTLLYYAGSSDGLWFLYIVCGYALFLLVWAFAIFGPLGSVGLLVILLILGIFIARRSIRPVAEGHVDIVQSFGKYTRTLFPGLNFLMPWEKVSSHLTIREKYWKTPMLKVNISRDQDVQLMATISYQLMPEDAYLAYTVENWEDYLHHLFVGTLESVINQLSPADFIAWPQGAHARSNIESIAMDPNMMTRWDRINDLLASRLQDAVAHLGVQVNWVRIQDITLIPHLSPVTNPPPGAHSRSMEAGMSRGAGGDRPPSTGGPAASQSQSQQAQPFPRAAEKQERQPHPQPQQPLQQPPQAHVQQEPQPQNRGASIHDATTTTVPQAIKVDVLIDAYEAVRSNHITDPETIMSIARRFEAIANDPEASQNVHFDAARAANMLYQRARAAEELLRTSVSSPAGRQQERQGQRAANENLRGGG